MNRRVLVIEPDATIRRMLEYALSAAGFAPSSAPTVEASRALLDGTPMDAVVLEMRATNSEGTDGVRALRADYPELPLVVTGTLLTPRVMQELIRARVDDVVPKPFTAREIASAVERVLQSSRTRHDGALELRRRDGQRAARDRRGAPARRRSASDASSRRFLRWTARPWPCSGWSPSYSGMTATPIAPIAPPWRCTRNPSAKTSCPRKGWRGFALMPGLEPCQPSSTMAENLSGSYRTP